jgi:hypothetical protein
MVNLFTHWSTGGNFERSRRKLKASSGQWFEIDGSEASNFEDSFPSSISLWTLFAWSNIW